MKKKLQKYLSGNQEGFSLVELIIVIAIMAILIGVIALAVIPYLNKARVSNDKTYIGNLYTAYQTAMASENLNKEIVNAMGTGNTITLTQLKGLTNTNKAMAESIEGGFKTSYESTDMDGVTDGNIYFYYDKTTKKLGVYVAKTAGTILTDSDGGTFAAPSGFTL